MGWHTQRGLDRLLSNQLRRCITQVVPRPELWLLSASGVYSELRRAGEIDIADQMVQEVLAALRRTM